MKSWIQHVKEFSKKHKMKYGEALKNAQCKTEYHSIHTKIFPIFISNFSPLLMFFPHSFSPFQ